MHCTAPPCFVATDQLQQQEIRRMAMIISQTQLSSNRLQKQLFIVVPPYDKIDGKGVDEAPFCYHIMQKVRESDSFLSSLRILWRRRGYILTFSLRYGKIIAV